MKNDLRENIFAILKEGPNSISEIARRVDGSKEFISGYLHGLADCGILKAKRIGKAKVFLIDDDCGGYSQRFPVNTERKQVKI